MAEFTADHEAELALLKSAASAFTDEHAAELDMLKSELGSNRPNAGGVQGEVPTVDVGLPDAEGNFQQQESPLPTAGEPDFSGQPVNINSDRILNPTQALAKSAEVVGDVAVSAVQGGLHLANLPFQAAEGVVDFALGKQGGFASSNSAAIESLNQLKKSDTAIAKVAGQGAEFAVGGGVLRAGVRGLATLAKLKPHDFIAKLERMIDGGAGAVGQTIEEFGGGATGNLIGSLVAGLGFSGATSLLKKISEIEQIKGAERVIGKMLDDIFTDDPQAKRRLEESIKSSEKFGTKPSIGQASENPDLLAIDNAVANKTATGKTVEAVAKQESLVALELEAREITGTSQIDANKVKALAAETMNGINGTLKSIIDNTKQILQKKVDDLRKNGADHLNIEDASSTGRKITEKIDDFLNTEVQNAYKAAGKGVDLPPNTRLNTIKLIKKGGKTETGEKSKEAGKLLERFMKRTSKRGLKGNQLTAENMLGFAKDAAESSVRLASKGKHIEAKAMREISDRMYANLDELGGKFDYAKATKKAIEDARKRAHFSVFNETDKYGTLLRTPESFNATFVNVDPSTARAAVEVAERGGQGAEFIQSVRDNFAVQLVTNATKNGRVNIKQLKRDIRNSADVLEVYGIKGEFDNISDVASIAEKAIAKTKADIVTLNQSALAKFVGAKNLGNFIKTDIKNGSIAKTNKSLPTQELRDAHKAMVYDELISSFKKSNKTSLREDTAAMAAFEDKTTSRALKKLLGERHFIALKQITAEAAKFRIKGGGASSDKVPGLVEAEKVRRFMFGRIRAALRGFIAPDFTAIEIANFAGTNAGNNSIRKLFLEMKFNPKLAIEIARRFRADKAFKNALLSLSSEGMVTAAIAQRSANPVAISGEQAADEVVQSIEAQQ